MYQGLRLWRRARGAVGQVVHGYRLMPLVCRVYHGVFPRPKNASPKRFLNGLSNPLHKKIKLTPCGISFISGGEQGAQSVRWFADIDLCRLRVRFITECSHALKTLPRSVFLTGFRIPCIKNKADTMRYQLYFWRRARDSNPRTGDSPLHDFQSCSFDQLGQLSVSAIKCSIIIYEPEQKIKCFFIKIRNNLFFTLGRALECLKVGRFYIETKICPAADNYHLQTGDI